MRSNQRAYGEGVYYVLFSYHRFEGLDDAEGHDRYFEEVYQLLDTWRDCAGGAEPIEETLSYYDEGGGVSLLVKCSLQNIKPGADTEAALAKTYEVQDGRLVRAR